MLFGRTVASCYGNDHRLYFPNVRWSRAPLPYSSCAAQTIDGCSDFRRNGPRFFVVDIWRSWWELPAHYKHERVIPTSQVSRRYGFTTFFPCFPQDLIFGDSAGCDWRNPKRCQRERSLTSALSSIIWRAGDGKTGEGKPFQQNAPIKINSEAQTANS